MKREHVSKHSWLVGMMVAGGLGCSNGEADNGEAGGAGGVAMGGGAGVALGPTGGTNSTGGRAASGGAGSGGTSSNAGGSTSVGGTSSGTGGTASGSGGRAAGGAGMTGAGTGGATGGAGAGGATAGDGGTAGMGTGGGGRSGGDGGKSGSGTGGAGKAGSSGTGGGSSGTCTASKSAGKSVSGTGPHKVVIETNSDNGIKCGTIFRPEDLGGTEKYPIFVWGEGGCSQNGLSNQAAMGEIASWGYFVVADGVPSGTACSGGQDGKAMLDYITWAIAENDKSCSAYYQSLEPTKVAADGFSCGGLMSENVSGDPRFTAIGITSSGLMGSNEKLYDAIHTPFKIMNGGSSDIAYENGLRDYEEISSRGKPIVYFSKTSLGHGGDLNNGRGAFNLVNLAWLNWQLKGDEGATGKGYLQGSTCTICTDSGWDYMAANIE